MPQSWVLQLRLQANMVGVVGQYFSQSLRCAQDDKSDNALQQLQTGELSANVFLGIYSFPALMK
mgnify:CR=1 FL=1